MHPKSGGSGVYEETAALLDWGFRQGANARPVGTLVAPLSEGGARATPAGKAPKAAAGAPARTETSGSSWGLVGGAGGAVALLAGGAVAWRRRRRAGAAGEAPVSEQRASGPGGSDTGTSETGTPDTGDSGARHQR